MHYIHDNYLLLDADMLVSEQMASLATYFGLGQQTHRSLDDVRMNLEVLKYCATVLLLESSLPDIFTGNGCVSQNATARSRINVRSSPEGTSQNLSAPSSKFKFENASNVSPPDQGKEEIHPIFTLVTQGTGELDSVLAVTTVDQLNPLDISLLNNQMETQSLQPDNTMEDKSEPESRQMWFTASLCCSRLKIRFEISRKFTDQAGRPKLSFLVDASQSLCTVLDACEVVVKKLVEHSGSSSEWSDVVTRKGGFFNHPAARLRICAEVFGNAARYATEIYRKDASGNIQKLMFDKFDAAELKSSLKPGTFVDAFLSLDPYDYQQRTFDDDMPEWRGAWFWGVHVFDEMPHRNVVSWTTMISGCAQNGKSKQALSLFNEVRRGRVGLDQVALVSALSACAEIGDLKLGKWIPSYVEEKFSVGREPVLVSLNNALIHMYASCSEIEEAYGLFRKNAEEEYCFLDKHD
ncbi:hypothetical protein WN944_029490 [Citrus x changshan-huyou]